jgi:rubrerythrin
MIFPFNAGEVFKIALQIEDNGRLFYETAAAKPFSTEIVQLFKGLAQEEISHKAIFTHLLKELPQKTAASTVWDPDNELDQYLKMMAGEHVFNQKPEALTARVNQLQTPADAIRLAMAFERDTIVFFLELEAASEKYDDSRAQIKKLVDEERKHLARLTRMLEKVLR